MASNLFWVRMGVGRQIALVTHADGEKAYGFKWRAQGRRWTQRLRFENGAFLRRLTQKELTTPMAWRALHAMPRVEVLATAEQWLREQETRSASYTLDGAPLDVPVGEFVAKNLEAFSHEDIRRVYALSPGESMTVAGGAAPDFTLARVAP